MNIRDKKKNIVCVSQCMYVCVCMGGMEKMICNRVKMRTLDARDVVRG